MNQESPFESYLTGRASEIDVPGAGPSAVVERARGRRRRRRAGAGAVLGVAVLLGGAVVGQGLTSSDDTEEVASYGAGVAGPTLEWTSVPSDRGLGWTQGLVQAGSGPVYGLSTAAGAADSPQARTPTLYGSTDGTDWSEVDLPRGLRANGIAADSDTIFAVGTSAAGGQVKVQVASSQDPSNGWSVTDLPLDLDFEVGDLPGRLFVAETATAANDGGSVVAAVLRLQIDDPAEVLPEVTDVENWYPTTEGMAHSRVCTEGDSGASGRTEDPSSTPMSTRPGAGDETSAGLAEERRSGCGPDERELEVISWADLGYGDDVGALIEGRTFVFVRDESGGYREATVVDGSVGPNGLLADDDGYWLVTPGYDRATGSENLAARHSIDGMNWDEAPLVFPGSLVASGTLAGRSTLLVHDFTTESMQMHRLGAGVETSDLTGAGGIASGAVYPAAAGIGPLGVVIAIAPEPGQRPVVLHSTDGVAFSRTDLPAVPEGKAQIVNGVTMTADAVKVRLNLYDADDEYRTVPVGQQLLVGTPH